MSLGSVSRARSSGQFDPPAFDKDCVKAVRDAAERLGYSHRDIVSAPATTPAGSTASRRRRMVMCPCVDGLSHNEDENISKEMGDRRRRCPLPRGGRDSGDRE